MKLKRMNKNKHWIVRLTKCILYDLSEGILRFYPLYILAILLFLVFSADAGIHMKPMKPGVLEILIYLFQGMEEYEYVKGGPPFQIPTIYLGVLFFITLFACYYPHREWKLRGNITITRYGDKKIWWFSKCIWCIAQMLIIFVLLFFILWLAAFAGGNGTLGFCEEIAGQYQTKPLITDTWQLYLYAFFCQCLQPLP